MRRRGHPSIECVVVLLSLLAVSAPAEGLPPGSEWTAIAPGLWYRPWIVPTDPEGASIETHAFRADPKVARVSVLDARRGERISATAAELRKEAGAYLVVNGGFFDERNRPLGLVVGQGGQRSALRRVDQGVFLIAADKPAIQHTRDPLPEKLDAALQAGPRLVVDGRPLHLKAQTSRRTSVCLPGDGTVVIVVSAAPISLVDLAENLARTPAQGGLGCWAALNLDGGPSTQLSLAAPKMTLEVSGGWPVPNGLAVVPRSSSAPAATTE